MPGTPQPQPQREDVESSQEDSEELQDQCVEESLREGSEAEEDVPSSQEEETLHNRLAQFVKQRPSLHQTMVLLQEPLWLRDLHGQVKQAGIKCGLNQLQVSQALDCCRILIISLYRTGWTFSASPTGQRLAGRRRRILPSCLKSKV